MCPQPMLCFSSMQMQCGKVCNLSTHILDTAGCYGNNVQMLIAYCSSYRWQASLHFDHPQTLVLLMKPLSWHYLAQIAMLWVAGQA